jgi:pimeloyl-ACP methyl ester carboxylesterase
MGDGNSIHWLLLHGVPLTPLVWDEVRAHLTGQPVLTPDTSLVPVGTATAWPPSLLATKLVAELPAGRFDLVGHSFGGEIAIELALLLGPRIRTLTILCSRDTPVPAFAPLAEALRQGEAIDVEANLARWFKAEDLAANGPAVRAARRCLAQADRASWAAARDAIATFDRTAEVAGIIAPATLIAAGHDGIATPDSMRGFAQRLANAELHVFDEWAHMSPFIDPAGLAAILRRAAQRGNDA